MGDGALKIISYLMKQEAVDHSQVINLKHQYITSHLST